MSELTLQSLEHGSDKFHEGEEDGYLVGARAEALKYMEDRAIGLRNPNWTNSWIRDHAQSAAAVRK